jgi:hypothetical protein
MSAAHKWVKGQPSPNPSGLRKDGKPRRKPRKLPPGLSRDEMTALSRSYGPEAVERLVFWMRSKNARMSLRASQLLLERGYGVPAPADRIESTMILHGDKAEGGGDIQLIFVHPTPQPEDESHMVH